jgi:hypothetical protein
LLVVGEFPGPIGPDVNTIGAPSYGPISGSYTDKRVTAITVNLTRIDLPRSDLTEFCAPFEMGAEECGFDNAADPADSDT